MSKVLNPHMTSAKIEVCMDGVTYVFELEDDEAHRLTGTLDLENLIEEKDDDGPWREFQPSGVSLADIHIKGKIKSQKRIKP